MKKQKGITLIALIITIILMLILAGVVLSLTIGENGLISTAEHAVQKNSEAEAKEKLELALADLQAHKYTDDAYNENEYIDDYLNNEKIEILGNIATVGKWDFEIDRSVPTIKEGLGKSDIKLTKEVKEYLGKNENDKYVVSVLVKIESNQKLESIDFENLDGTILTVVPEKETTTKDMQIELDKQYKIAIKMADGKIQTKTIIERSVENIRTVEELVAFRDKVNTGLTYEGKTVNLINDIDLIRVCYRVDGTTQNDKSWEPIGNYDIDDTHIFKGIFDGKGHNLNNIYINTNRNYQGFFGYAQSGEIKNINIKSGNINGYQTVGGLVGYASEITIDKVGSEVTVNATNTPAGGIVSIIEKNSKIKQCYNKGDISSNVNVNFSGAGGIIGSIGSGNEIIDCYNVGNISSNIYTGGIVGGIGAENNKIINCYNTGNVLGRQNDRKGGIVGAINSETGYVEPYNNYWKNDCGAIYGLGEWTSNLNAMPLNETEIKKSVEKLGEAYTDDIEISEIDKLTDETKKVWKYNNGYPILKWQLK